MNLLILILQWICGIASIIGLVFLIIDNKKEKKYSRKLLLRILIGGIILSITLALIQRGLDKITNVEKEEVLQLTVFVTDVKGNVVLEHEGKLNTSIGNRPLRETIGEDGRCNFGDILPKYLGDSIRIGLQADGWEVAGGKNTFVFDGNPITLEVRRDNSLCTIKGTIRDRSGDNTLANATIHIGADTTIYANIDGSFRIVLPFPMCVRKKTDRYRIVVSKEGYQPDSQYYTPQSSDLDFRLIPKQ